LALIETSPVLRARQESRLGPRTERTRWLDPSFPEAPTLGVGCVFANELLDALPVHRVLVDENGFREVFVSVEDDSFVEIADRPSTDELERQIRDGGGVLN